MAKLDDPKRKELIPIENILDMLDIQEGEWLLDFGCGIGFLTLTAAKRLKCTGFVYGIDIQKDMLEEGLARSIKNNLHNIAWVLTSPDKITLPANFVDCVTMVLVAHEVPSLSGLIRECYRVLKPGGRIGIVEWNSYFSQMGPPVSHRLKPEVVSEELTNNSFTHVDSMSISPAVYMVQGLKVK